MVEEGWDAHDLSRWAAVACGMPAEAFHWTFQSRMWGADGERMKEIGRNRRLVMCGRLCGGVNREARFGSPIEGEWTCAESGTQGLQRMRSQQTDFPRFESPRRRTAPTKPPAASNVNAGATEDPNGLQAALDVLTTLLPQDMMAVIQEQAVSRTRQLADLDEKLVKARRERGRGQTKRGGTAKSSRAA